MTDELLQHLWLYIGKHDSPKYSQYKGGGWDNEEETKKLFEGGGKQQDNGKGQKAGKGGKSSGEQIR